jgi:hypothetical protein
VLVTVIAAFGIAAPVGSFTVPTMLPLSDWANNWAAQNATAAAINSMPNERPPNQILQEFLFFNIISVASENINPSGPRCYRFETLRTR